MIGDVRKLFDDGLLVLEFRVENAQRIGFDAALGVGAEFVFHSFEFGFEFRGVAAAAIVSRMADGVDAELSSLEAALVEERHQHFDEFGVDGGSVRTTKNFRANLIELAIAPFLRPFAAKHRPHVIQLHRLRKLLHVVLNVSAAHARRGLRPQYLWLCKWKIGHLCFAVVYSLIKKELLDLVARPGCQLTQALEILLDEKQASLGKVVSIRKARGECSLVAVNKLRIQLLKFGDIGALRRRYALVLNLKTQKL